MCIDASVLRGGVISDMGRGVVPLVDGESEFQREEAVKVTVKAPVSLERVDVYR